MVGRIEHTMESATSRGLYWVIGQFVLLGIIVLASLIDPFKHDASLIAQIGAGICIVASILCLVRAFAHLGSSLTPFPKPLTTGTLVTSGMYAIVRHPIYTGLLLGCAGVTLFSQSPVALLATLILAVWLNFKANYEETWLVQQYPDYADYRLRTKKFIPFIW